MWRSLRLNEKPRIVVDCQFIANEFDDFSSRLAVQLLQIIKVKFLYPIIGRFSQCSGHF